MIIYLNLPRERDEFPNNIFFLLFVRLITRLVYTYLYYTVNDRGDQHEYYMFASHTIQQWIPRAKMFVNTCFIVIIDAFLYECLPKTIFFF